MNFGSLLHHERDVIHSFDIWCQLRSLSFIHFIVVGARWTVTSQLDTELAAGPFLWLLFELSEDEDAVFDECLGKRRTAFLCEFLL